ncbi:hypothetical protein [Streptomyces sp. NPDC005799]|uniref:hypothetical protein n=1 Tax=Streptomyces sp. NPDC005799 TaxID=3154678 RepID=UPI003406AB6C
MNDHITVGAGALVASMAGATVIARAWPAPARHRTAWRLPSLSVLLGAPSAYTTPDVPELAVVPGRFADCPICDRAEAGTVTKDHTWRCGSCGTHVLVGGA